MSSQSPAAAYSDDAAPDMPGGSPSFTPTRRDKPLPPIRPESDPADLQTPVAWYTPKSESPVKDSAMVKLCSEEFPQWGAIDERQHEQQMRSDSFSQSPVSYSSSSQLDSTRLSCSTLASLPATRTCSESSAATSPLGGYGVALGSPRRDSYSQEGGERRSRCVGPSPIGLGLSEEQAAAIVPASGPFSHHRTPSWTLQNIMGGRRPSTAAAHPFPPPPVPSSDDINMPTWPVKVPPRGTSRSRSNSFASLKVRQGKLNAPFDESLAFPQPSPVRSGSSHSISSSTADSSFSHVSPRSSSLKKTKMRPKLLSKASEPTLTTLRPPPHSSSITNRAKAGSVSEAQRRGCWNGWTQDRVATTAGSSSTMRDLDDYLAYTAGSALDLLPLSPVKSAGMAPNRILVLSEGVTLDELERQAGPSTTHLLLSGCQDASLVDFLNSILPVVGPSLVVLDVSKTSLTHLPDSLIHCTSLEELNISHVAFSRPWKCHALSRLSTLRVLLADSCQFVIVPVEIAQLHMLKTLSLQHNSLSHLPSWLHRLTLLEKLCLNGNPFQGQWQQVCEAFVTRLSISSSRPAMERAPDSAPSRMDTSLDAPFEEYEEMADELPVTAPLANNTIRAKDDKHRRPLMQRMMSASNDSPFDDSPLRTDAAAAAASARARSSSQVLEEKKWGTLMRKLGRKASNSHMMPSAPSSGASSPVKSRSNSLQHQHDLITRAVVPLTPVGWQESISGDSSWSSSQSKRDNYLAISQDGPDAQHRRHLQALMQYLKDLDNLSALRLGPPGTVLAMETSMATRYASPTKGMGMAGMDRSGSETSRESMHSTSSSSSASQVTSDQSDRGIAATAAAAPATTATTKDDAHRRIRILQEIVATEETYIRGLQELVDIYVVPSAAPADSSNGQSVIPLADRRHVFANVEGIFHFHQSAFLPALRLATQSITDDLERRRSDDAEAYNAQSASMTEQVASVFTKHAAYFRMYTAYVNNVDAAQRRVAQWKQSKANDASTTASAAATTAGDGSSNQVALSPKERKRVKAFLQKAKLDPRHSQLSLETYLHLPVQRIPRYRLLFEDLVRSCPSHRLQDPTAITKALDSICSVATLMNESKRQSENDRKLLEWQARIRGQFASPLLQPHRRLVRDGDLVLKRVVMRTTAFHMAKSQWLDEECQQSTQCDGAVTDTDLGIVQIDCLDQQSMSKDVHVLLCNDITVVLVKDDSHGSSSTSPVDLFAVLRIQSPVELVGQTTLRVVDPKHILYFSASSPAQAQEWKAAIMSVHQEPRMIKAAHTAPSP